MNQTNRQTEQKASRGRPKDPEKAEKILHAAAHLFLAHGLKGTSMDAVAKEADVSKQTLYSHFAGKDALYGAVIKSKVSSYKLSETTVLFSGNLEEDLNTIGQQVLLLEMDPDAIAMLRVVLEEGHSYKKTSQLFYENGPKKVTHELTRYFESREIEDARFYAVAFLNILMSEWQMKALMGLQPPPDEKEIASYVRKVSKRFIKMLP